MFSIRIFESDDILSDQVIKMPFSDIQPQHYHFKTQNKIFNSAFLSGMTFTIWPVPITNCRTNYLFDSVSLVQQF